jgi:hypothetical protein
MNQDPTLMNQDPPRGGDNPLGEPRGKRIVETEATGSTLAEQAHEPTPLALQAQTLSDDARALTAEVAAMRKAAVVLARRTHTLNRRTTIALSVLTALVLIIVTGGVLLYRQSVTTDFVTRNAVCQSAQNDAFRDAIIQRNEAAAKERAAQRTLFDTVLSPTATPDQKRAASQEYYAGLVAADQQRNANPLPTGNCS